MASGGGNSLPWAPQQCKKKLNIVSHTVLNNNAIGITCVEAKGINTKGVILAAICLGNYIYC